MDFVIIGDMGTLKFYLVVLFSLNTIIVIDGDVE
jgi:hypothetical protein